MWKFLQRYLQELALRLQAAGRQYKRQKPQKAKQAQTGGDSSAAAQRLKPGQVRGSGQSRGTKAAPWETGDRPDHPVVVIVVPVFWLKREHEMRDVLQAAEKLKNLLAGGN